MISLSLVQRRFIYAASAVLILYISAQAFYILAFYFLSSIHSTGDAQRDRDFDEAIMKIAQQRNNGDSMYGPDLSSYFSKAKIGLSKREFHDYINKRIGISRGPSIANSRGYKVVYQEAAMIKGLNLKLYSLKFSWDDRIVFGYAYSDPDYSVLIDDEITLVATGVL